jgi:soluble lytic murein transglycosylase-like protein
MGLLLGTVGQGAMAAKFFVYQLPDGSRVISDRPIHKSTHKLVSSRRGAEGTGQLAASRYKQRPSALNELESLIRQVSQRHSMDVALVKAVIHTESYFKIEAKSRVGASGLMQLMPATAKIYGVDDIYDPVQNLEAGVKHLRYLINKYDNNLKHALAAYNAGEKAVYFYKGVPPYEETQNYVQKVLHFHDYYKRVY